MATGESLFVVPALLRELRDVGPRERIPEVFEAHFIQAWFAFEPAELRTVLEAAPEGELRTRPVASYVLAVLRGEPVPLLEDAKHNGLKVEDAIGRGTAIAMAVLEARMRGEMHFALSLLDSIRADAQARNALLDGSKGGASFAGVQAGITRMLAGDFRGALTEFERVKWTRPPADLAFLVRDAHAKAALVHALFGDPDLARREVVDAARCERTTSWAEPVVDATAQLATILIGGAHGESILERLLALPRQDIGEMWPYYVLALIPSALAGESGAEHVLTVLEQSDLPGSSTGQGLPGSASPLARAALAARASNTAAARAGIGSADPDMPLTTLMAAGVALDTGAAAQALALAARIAPQTDGLRQLELWRLSIVHLAHHALEEDAAAKTTRRQVAQLAEGLPRMNLPVAGSAGEHIRGVLAGESAPVRPRIQWLTPREAEILTHLAEGLNRREIAERLFVSLNTIKTQVSSLYRKLGASSRDTLLGAAYERGLL